MEVGQQVPFQKSKNDIDNGTSYRPISIISVIPKTLEKSIPPYIAANIPNPSTQHGYKTQPSTVMALHTLNNTVSKGLNKWPSCPNNHCSTRYEHIFRFDTINIHTLIRMLLPAQIPGTIIKFLANYINGRKAYTPYRNQTSI